MHGLTSDTAI